MKLLFVVDDGMLDEAGNFTMTTKKVWSVYEVGASYEGPLGEVEASSERSALDSAAAFFGVPRKKLYAVPEPLAASSRQRSHSTKKTEDLRGEDAFRNIQHEARAAESEANMADNTRVVAAQHNPQYAHGLVERSKQHADQAARFVELAQAWVREAQGTPQFDSVTRVLASVRSTAARAKTRATATQKAFEKRFGKYDPRGVRDHATVKKRRRP